MNALDTQVKICGVTSLEDARAAVSVGAAALGFMFWEGSSRRVEPGLAAAMIRELPRRVLRVGVFVNAPASVVRQVAVLAGLDVLQFHGEEPPAYCRGFEGWRVWKAFRIRDRGSLEGMEAYTGLDGWLLDSYVPGQRGGSGAVFNWDLAVEARALARPMVLAGGLTPGNVGAAVTRVRPDWVDVSSGVELAPGRKDAVRMGAFVQAVKEASAGGR